MSDTIVTFEWFNDVFVKVVVDASTETEENFVHSSIYASMAFMDEKKRFTWEFKHGYTDGKVYLYDRISKILPIGLVPRVSNILRETKPHIKIKIDKHLRTIYTPYGGVNVTRKELELFVDRIDIHNREEGFNLTPYEHQYKIVERALNARRISLLACTAAGKSLSMYMITRWLVDRERKKVLIITPSSNLVEQLYSDFYNDYGWLHASKYCTLLHSDSNDKLTKLQIERLEELGLGEESKLKQVTISTWQSLQNKPNEFFLPFDAVLIDEAHGARGEVLRAVVDRCINASTFKVGLSGTLPDDGLDAALIESSIGRKEEIVRLYELIENGTLTPCEVNAVVIPYKDEAKKIVSAKKTTYQEEVSMLTNNGSRQAVMKHLFDSNTITTKENTILLYKSKSSLDDMNDYLTEHHPEFNIHIIKGEVKTKDREVIRKGMESSVGNIILATYGTFRQGVNVKLLHNLVFAEFSKSMYEVVQSIGRIVRAHKDKPLARVFDLVDDCSYFTAPRNGYKHGYLIENYAVKHFKTRTLYYEDDKIPIKKIDLTGIYEADIGGDSVKEKKEKVKRKLKTKSKTSNVFSGNAGSRFIHL